jgi:membrane protein implicated in regulation of membrane protease activity
MIMMSGYPARALRWLTWLTALLLVFGVLMIVPLTLAALADEVAPAWAWLAWAGCLLAVVLLPRRWARSMTAPPWKTARREHDTPEPVKEDQ